MGSLYSRPSRRIAFCGTRGVPANYGGFETAVDEISQLFVDQGFACDVFCRTSSRPDVQAGEASEGGARAEPPGFHRGRRLIYVAGSTRRTLDTFVSAVQTARYLWRHRKEYDYVFWFNNANLLGILMTRLMGLPMAVNTDGLEWRRSKWTWPFKAYYILSSFLIARLCTHLISDSRAIQAYYRRYFLKRTHFIPYGARVGLKVPFERQQEVLESYGLESGRYFLQITRIEPDNIPLDTARAFIESGLGEKGYTFLIVGVKEKTDYAEALCDLNGVGGVRVVPAVYDTHVVSTLRQNCHGYVHGNSVGGTNPALLEAMSECPRIIAVDVPFSHETLGPLGHFFSADSLAADFSEVLGAPSQHAKLRERVAAHYDWSNVADCYMQLACGEVPSYQANWPPPVWRGDEIPTPETLEMVEGRT